MIDEQISVTVSHSDISFFLCVEGFLPVCVYVWFLLSFCETFLSKNTDLVQSSIPHREQSLILMRQSVISQVLVKRRCDWG